MPPRIGRKKRRDYEAERLRAAQNMPPERIVQKALVNVRKRLNTQLQGCQVPKMLRSSAEPVDVKTLLKENALLLEELSRVKEQNLVLLQVIHFAIYHSVTFHYIGE